ncbi:hypothetical protein GCM10023185_45920 [Hymenobacter saemangeumensis]|uniref:Choice-of-anchor D domain-containing protein n=2 Tax=Hymenobacter saemangeumensis TaxID=1084522 RepID=A0ABP8ISR0_9BACT
MAQTVDGTRDASYPAALALQTVETGFGDNQSELNNIHAQIVGSDLYIFIGGNLEANGNKLELFFDTRSGGQNTLGSNSGYAAVMNGLTFDSGFSADFGLTVYHNGSTLQADYVVLPTAGGGATGAVANGMGSPQALNFNSVVAMSGTGEAAINNANMAGVAGGGSAAANAMAAAAVSTGIELRIPLSALGTSVGNGDIKINVFVNGGGHDYVSNQVLAGLPAPQGNLGGNGSGGYTGGTAGINFGSFAGNQFVTVANGMAAMQPQIAVSPSSLSFFNVAVTGGSATRTVNIANNGAAPLNVSSIVSNNAAFTASANAFTVAAGASANVTITFDPSAAGAATGTLTISSNDPTNPTLTVSMSGTGVADGQVVLDGMVDASLYGAPKAVQTTPTGFGDNQSELNAAYVRMTATDLYLTLTGNLEGNGNKLVLFFDADPNAGQTSFSASNPSVDFGASNNLAGLAFDRGFRPESFLSLNHGGGSLFANFAPMNGAGGSGTYLSTSGNAFTQMLDFGGGAMGELSFNNSNTAGVSDMAVGNPAAVMTGVELRIPLSALGAGITGTTPIHVMALITNGGYDYLSNQTLGGLPMGTGNLGADGSGNGGVSPLTVDLLNFPGNQFFTAQRGNLTVPDTRDIAGEYNNVTVTASGQATINSPLDITGTFQVQGTAGFAPLPGANVTGSGATVVSGLGILAITSPQGITASGASGNVQTTTRNFGSTAGYAYLGITPQVTGSGLPAVVGGLGVNNASGVTLSQAVSVGQVVRLQNGNLNTNGNMLTLLSTPSASALIDNTGGVVNGTVTVQRAINPSLNAGAGYRHYSSPVQSTTFADLTTAGFSPVLNTAYNTAANPGAITPFPNVFGYDESRINTSPATGISDFDKGWFVPTGTMVPGRGYTVNIPASALVDFVGAPNNGNRSLTLTRVGGANGGWHLVGNPYPSPMDWSQVAAADRSGLDNAMYVFESSSQYGGSYRSFVNGMGGSSRIAMGQGFFVRVSSGQPSGTLTFRNSQRLTDFTQQVPFRRDAVDTRAMLQLQLSGAGISDEAIVYFQAGAPAAADAQYDAVKLSNPHGLNLASLAGTDALAINGLPLLTGSTVLPLRVEVPAAGSYTFSAAALRNLPGTVYLLDASTGQRINLSQQPSYTFAATAAPLTGRFALVFEPAAAPLASNSALEAARISVFPNPAQGKFTVLVPTAAKAVTVTVFNSLGQQVRRVSQQATADATAVALDAAGLAAGVYTLRVQAGTAAPVTKRVVLE